MNKKRIIDLTEWGIYCTFILTVIAIVMFIFFMFYNSFLHHISDKQITETASRIVNQEMYTETRYPETGNTLVPVICTEYIIYLENGVEIGVTPQTYGWYNVGMYFPLNKIEYLDANGNVWDTAYEFRN